MHGIGWGLHRSHHRPPAAALEANDAFPVIFASATVLAMAAGRRPSLRHLQDVGAGVTLYGMAYGFVHDVYIHARLGRLPRVELLERLKDAHRFHHLYGGEPFGMLLPVVPARVRAMAAARGREWSGSAADPLARGRRAVPAPGAPRPRASAA
ncbi:MAG: beta-carotene hydroxylase [Acidimicrobiales bacterium]